MTPGTYVSLESHDFCGGDVSSLAKFMVLSAGTPHRRVTSPSHPDFTFAKVLILSPRSKHLPLRWAATWHNPPSLGTLGTEFLLFQLSLFFFTETSQHGFSICGE